MSNYFLEQNVNLLKFKIKCKWTYFSLRFTVESFSFWFEHLQELFYLSANSILVEKQNLYHKQQLNWIPVHLLYFILLFLLWLQE